MNTLGEYLQNVPAIVLLATAVIMGFGAMGLAFFQSGDKAKNERILDSYTETWDRKIAAYLPIVIRGLLGVAIAYAAVFVAFALPKDSGQTMLLFFFGGMGLGVIFFRTLPWVVLEKFPMLKERVPSWAFGRWSPLGMGI